MAAGRVSIHRFTTILLICILIISLNSMTMAFTDTDGHWAELAIEKWSGEYGVFLGSNGLFRPNDEITRAEMAVLLERLLMYTQTTENSFSDIKGDEWYADAVIRLNAAGVMLGDGARANPDGKVTREQAVALLVRAFLITASGSLGLEQEYADHAVISDWAMDAVDIMTARGYIQGNGGRFNPKGNLTRAEAVTIFNNIFSGVYSDGGIYTGYMGENVLINSDNPVVLRDMTIMGDLYIAYGVPAPVTLDDVIINGEIINLSAFEPVLFSSREEEREEHEEREDVIIYGSYEVPIIESLPKNPYADELFYYDSEGRMRYGLNEEALIGIDISAWQQDVDWDRVREQGIDFVMLRVGYRGYTEGNIKPDAYFHQNIKGALAAGLKVGVYFFSQAINAAEAREEARFMLGEIAGYDITFPVVFDWEPVADENARTRGLATEVVCEAANVFCREVEAAGYIPMVYFNLFTGYIKYDLLEIAQYDFWLAQYADTPTFYYDFQMWQYTSGGTVDGVSGGVDMNISFVDYSLR